MTDGAPKRRALAWIRSQTWAIQQESLQLLREIAAREHVPDFEAVLAKQGQALDHADEVQVREGGVAVVDVRGPIFRYASFFTRISAAMSIEQAALDLRAAQDDPRVRSIVLNVDSPGGDVNGVSEFAQMVRDSRKTVTAYVGGTAASAGYWIASAASRIVASNTAVLGSIGVVASFYMDDDESLVEIVSSQSPDKRVDPRSDSGRQKVQSRVDDLADVFISTVASYRRVSRDKVLADFGRGGVLIGAKAIAAGMGDAVGSLESLIAELAGPASSFRSQYMTTNAKGPVVVTSTAELHAAIHAGHTVQEVTIDTEPARKAGHVAGLAEGEAKVKPAVDSALADDRKRVSKISSVAMTGFEKDAAEAIEKGMSAGDFALKQAETAKDRGVSVAAIKADSTGAAPHGGAGGATADVAAKGWDKAAKRHGAKS